jgi:hypothetical protein
MGDPSDPANRDKVKQVAPVIEHLASEAPAAIKADVTLVSNDFATFARGGTVPSADNFNAALDRVNSWIASNCSDGGGNAATPTTNTPATTALTPDTATNNSSTSVDTSGNSPSSSGTADLSAICNDARNVKTTAGSLIQKALRGGKPSDAEVSQAADAAQRFASEAPDEIKSDATNLANDLAAQTSDAASGLPVDYASVQAWTDNNCQ